MSKQDPSASAGNIKKPHATEQAAQWAASLEAMGIYLVTVNNLNELEVIFHKSGGGMSDILNTIPAIGPVGHQHAPRGADAAMAWYQVWISGSLYRIENNIRLHQQAIHALSPVYCEQLVVVMEEQHIASEAYPSTRSPDRGGDMLIARQQPDNGDTEPFFAVGAHRANQIVVYIVGDQPSPPNPAPLCGPDCDCW